MNKKKQKLLYIINVDWFLISHRLPILLAAKMAGYEIHIACAVTSKREDLERYGFYVHSIPLSRGKAGLVGEIRAFKAIYNTIKALKPDVMHLITIKPVLYGGISARLLGVKKVVFSISGLGYVFIQSGVVAKFRLFFVSFLYRIAVSKEAFIIFQNQEDLNSISKLLKLNSSQSFLIDGSGIDLMEYKFESEPNGIPVVLMAGRILWDKGLQEFIDAARIVNFGETKARFYLAGKLDLENPSAVSKSNLDNLLRNSDVEYLGFIENMSKLILSSNIVVLPSYREGLPKFLIEAAASGRAVVTTNVPGCKDAIHEGVTGLLVPVKDAKALADAISDLITSPELRRKMGRAARKMAEERFDIKKVVDTHLRIYNFTDSLKIFEKF